jgi:hypothetical protein
MEDLRSELPPPLDLHLDAEVRYKISPTGNRTHLWSLGEIAVGILFIACVNAASVATAHAVARYHGVRARKVVGASRWQVTGRGPAPQPAGLRPRRIPGEKRRGPVHRNRH